MQWGLCGGSQTDYPVNDTKCPCTEVCRMILICVCVGGVTTTIRYGSPFTKQGHWGCPAVFEFVGLRVGVSPMTVFPIKISHLSIICQQYSHTVSCVPAVV